MCKNSKCPIYYLYKPQPTEDFEALSKDDVLNYERERYDRFSNGNHALSHLHMANQCTISYEEGFTKGYQLAKKFLETEQATKQVVKESLTTKKQII